MGWISILRLPMAGGEGFEDGKGKPLRYIYPFYFRPPPPARRDRHFGVLLTSPSTMPPSRSPEVDDTDDVPPPYTADPTDDVSLEFGPTRPFRTPPHHQPPPRQPDPEVSDFARDFYRSSRSIQEPRQPPQQSVPGDGRPTRTPVPGHPLLNNGRTLVYPAGYECRKCLFPSPQILSAPVDDAM
jgi:hypothetical protein